ncbi:MAG: AAA family ATPase [Saprospiraceae bacterium]|nr:AAA family ATPase [Saprospiraceae bacterium]
MDDQSIHHLREALRFSPENVPLRLHLAEVLLNTGRLDEAEEQYNALMKLADEDIAKRGLVKVFFNKGNYSKCIVLLEVLMEDYRDDFELQLLYTKALYRENSIADAVAAYQRLHELQPDFKDEELDEGLKVRHLQEEEDMLESLDDPTFLQKPNIRFEHVGGMDGVKKEIDLKIIKPIQHADLYKAYGKKAGGGILLYGPPGCGKTFIAKATAGEVDAKFVNVGLNDILDMWIGNSEKNLNRIFETARNNTPCVLFFDEIDALGANRRDMKQSAGKHVINQFLVELDGVENDNENVLILGATNAPWHLDPAFRRPGRFDRIIFVPPPDQEARAAIFTLKLANKPVGSIDYHTLAAKTESYSGADIEAVIDIAIEEKLEASFSSGIPKPMETKDLLNAIKKHKPSTAEWFTTARNFALFANDSGLYDDILKYLKIKK